MSSIIPFPWFSRDIPVTLSLLTSHYLSISIVSSISSAFHFVSYVCYLQVLFSFMYPYNTQTSSSGLRILTHLSLYLLYYSTYHPPPFLYTPSFPAPTLPHTTQYLSLSPPLSLSLSLSLFLSLSRVSPFLDGKFSSSFYTFHFN